MHTPIYPICYLLFFITKYTVGNTLLEVTLKMLKDVETVCVFGDDIQAGKLTKLLSNENITIESYGSIPTENKRHCKMNVVVIDSVKTMEELYQTHLSGFTTHSRILLIATDVHDFDYSIFFNMCLKNDLDLLVFNQDFETNHFPLRDPTSNISLHSVLKNKTILIENKGLEDLTDVLERPEWDMVEMVRRLNITFNILGYARSPYVQGTNENPSGFDVELVKLILKKFPLKFELVNQTINPFLYMNERLTNGTSDLNIGALWLTVTTSGHKFELTTPHYQQCLKLAVHKPILLPEFTFMFQYFSLSLWAFLLVNVGALSSFLAFEEMVLKSKFPMVDSIMVIASGFVGGSFKGNLTKSLVKDITILIWSVASLWIVTYCNAGLTTLINLPRVTSDINTFQDMLEGKIHWFFKIAAMKESVYSFGGIYAKLADLFLHSNNSTYVNSMIKTGQYGTVVESLPGRLLTNIDTLDGYSRSHLKVIDECFLNNYVAFQAQHNSPYVEYIDQKIGQVASFGFVDFLMGNVVDHEQKRVSSMFYSPYSGEVVKILDLSKMQGAFWLLLIGWSFGLFVFLWRLVKIKLAREHQVGSSR